MGEEGSGEQRGAAGQGWGLGRGVQVWADAMAPFDG